MDDLGARLARGAAGGREGAREERVPRLPYRTVVSRECGPGAPRGRGRRGGGGEVRAEFVKRGERGRGEEGGGARGRGGAGGFARAQEAAARLGEDVGHGATAGTSGAWWVDWGRCAAHSGTTS